MTRISEKMAQLLDQLSVAEQPAEGNAGTEMVVLTKRPAASNGRGAVAERTGQCQRHPLCTRKNKHPGHCKLAGGVVQPLYGGGGQGGVAGGVYRGPPSDTTTAIALPELRPKRESRQQQLSDQSSPVKNSHKKKCALCGVPGCKQCAASNGGAPRPSQRVGLKRKAVPSPPGSPKSRGDGAKSPASNCATAAAVGVGLKRKATAAAVLGPSRGSPTSPQSTDVRSSPQSSGESEADRAPDGLVVHGYCQVVKLLCEGQHILTNTTVQRVAKQPDGRIKVTARDGRSWAAKYVVCTLPLGVLKGWAPDTQVRFSPALSMPKQLAINQLGFGTENKVVLRFARAWWPDRDSPYAKKAYIQCTDVRFRFLDLDRHGKAGLLVAHVSPPFSLDYGGLDDEQLVELVLECIQSMFPMLLPLPPIVDSLVTRWQQDPYSCGAYSFYATGSSYHSVTALRRPEWPEKNRTLKPAAEAALLEAEEEDTADKTTYAVRGERLFFAGEACSTASMQCVSGAVETGERAGRRIAQLLRKPTDSANVVTRAPCLAIFSHICSRGDRIELKRLPMQVQNTSKSRRSASASWLRSRPRAEPAEGELARAGD